MVEEYDYSIERGRIAKILVDRKVMTVVECKILLDLDIHLSFPFIWKVNNDVFVAPESYHLGKWDIYKYDTALDTLTYHTTLANLPFTDAVSVRIDNQIYVLSTYEPSPNGSIMSIYKSKDLCLPIVSNHKDYEYRFCENIARNAGGVFTLGDKLIRPAQESNNSYGHAMVFQEIHLHEDSFEFNEIYRFTSPHKKYNRGTHTFNTFKNYAIIDVKGYRYPCLAKIISIISRCAVRFNLKSKYIIK